MAIINGIPVNFGFQGTGGITITGISGIILQSADWSKAADVESARDGQGAIVARGWYDIHDEATLEWIISGTNLAASITNTDLATVEPGDIITISACTSMPTLITSVWEVQSGAKITGSNTTFKKLSCTIHRRAGITGAAT